VASAACAVRILLVIAATVCLLATQRTLGLTAHALGVLLVLVSGATVSAERRGARSLWLHRSAIAVEVVLLAEWIRVFSGTSVVVSEGWEMAIRAEPLFTLAYVPVLVAALIDGPRGSLAAACLAIVAFIVRIGQTPTGMRAVLLGSFAPHFLPLIFVALVAGYLARAAERERTERARRESELEEFSHTLRLAAEMHHAVRPTTETSIPGADLVVRDLTSQRGLGGGDFCAVVPSGEHTYWFCVADVAGKTLAGLASMPLAYAAFWTSVRHHDRPEDCVRDINALLDTSTRCEVFVALFLARYDAKTGELSYCNAGQPDALVATADGVRTLTEGGPPAGAIPASMGATYCGGSVVLAGGDTLLIGTDGVLGDEEVAEAVAKGLMERKGSLEAAARAVLETADAADDRAIIMLRRRPGR
jgi:serine phosphatase RsbU (regulator of sigma subunit)